MVNKNTKWLNLYFYFKRVHPQSGSNAISFKMLFCHNNIAICISCKHTLERSEEEGGGEILFSTFSVCYSWLFVNVFFSYSADEKIYKRFV
jgi:hypothetical protein